MFKLITQLLRDSWAVIVSRNFIFYLWTITLLLEVLVDQSNIIKWLLLAHVFFSIYLYVAMTRSYFRVRIYFDSKVKIALLFSIFNLVFAFISFTTAKTGIVDTPPVYLTVISSMILFVVNLVTPISFLALILWSILRCHAFDFNQPLTSTIKIVLGYRESFYTLLVISVFHVFCSYYFISILIEVPVYIAWVARYALGMPPKIKKKQRSAKLQEIAA